MKRTAQESVEDSVEGNEQPWSWQALQFIQKNFQPTEMSAHLIRRFNAVRAFRKIRPSAERLGQRNPIASLRWNALAVLNKFGTRSDRDAIEM
jgi:hypothetical protein